MISYNCVEVRLQWAVDPQGVAMAHLAGAAAAAAAAAAAVAAAERLPTSRPATGCALSVQRIALQAGRSASAAGHPNARTGGGVPEWRAEC